MWLLSLLGGAFKLAAAGLGFLRDRVMFRAGEARANMENIRESKDRVYRASDARDAADGVRDKDFGGE